MKIGFALNISSAAPSEDGATIHDQLSLCRLIEPLGFDSIFVFEHHFTGYIVSPSPLQLLSYLAAITSKIDLGTSVIVLPLQNPLLIAEQIAMLDILSNGRGVISFGRGSSSNEFEGLSIPMMNSRQLFQEGIRIIKGCLENENFEYIGEDFIIPKLTIRPRPQYLTGKSFYASATEKKSLEILAEMGMGILMSAQRDWSVLKEDFEFYKSTAISHQQSPVMPIIIAMVSVDHSGEKAIARALKYMDKDLSMVDDHYQFSQGKLSSIPGYESYKNAEKYFGMLDEPEFRKNALQDILKSQIIGTPADCIEQILLLQQFVPFDQLVLEFSYGRMPLTEAHANLTLFADSVLSWFKNENIES